MIMDVAQSAFFCDGYARTTMSSIAARIGGSKTTLWSHFATKEALLAEIMRRAAQRLRTGLEAAIASHDGFEANLRRFCQTYIALICSVESIAAHRLVVAETRQFPELGHLFYEHSVAVPQQVLVGVIERAIAADMLAAADTAEMAELLRSLCHGRCFQRLMLGVVDTVSSEEIREDAEFVIDVVMRVSRRS